MGQVIEARFEEIRPSKLGFRLDNIFGILMGERRRLLRLPAPFRKSEYCEGMYTSIDGNSRIVRLMMEDRKSAKIYLAESDEDIMLTSVFPTAADLALMRSNFAIQDNWTECEKNAEEIAKRSDIKNYRDYFNKLLVQHPYLKSASTFLDYVKINKEEESLSLPIGRLEDLS